MPTPSYRAAVVAAAALMASACSRPEPITVSENVVVVHNRSTRDWRDVVVTVNDHFRGGAPHLAAGGRLTAPLSQFQTGFGQRYDIERQSVFKVEVSATDSRGEPVTLTYGGDRKTR